jgi:hypothetical protein
MQRLCVIIQPNPNLAKPSQASPSSGQIRSKEKAWISLDSLGGNEPFQRVIVTPLGTKIFLIFIRCSVSVM